MPKKIKQQKKIDFKDPFFLSLPIELWINIIKFASVETILCLFVVSKSSHCIMHHDEIKKELIQASQGLPNFLFRGLKANHSDIPEQIHILLCGSAEESDMRSFRGIFYFNNVSASLPEYFPSVLPPTEILYNKKHKISISDVHPMIDYENLLRSSRFSKPTVIIIYPSSIGELEKTVSKFAPIKDNEIIVVCSSSSELLEKAQAIQCEPLVTKNDLSIPESRSILKQCLDLISSHGRVKNNPINHKCCLM